MDGLHIRNLRARSEFGPGLLGYEEGSIFPQRENLNSIPSVGACDTKRLRPDTTRMRRERANVIFLR
jgi:hypothetical protein